MDQTAGNDLVSVRELIVHGLKPVTFTVAAGECVAIVGPSGAGKTVLLRALADLDPHEGNVSFAGTERHAMSGPVWRTNIRYAAAEPGWWGERPCDHIPAGTPVDSMTSALGLTRGQCEQSLAELSTGERQRFALVRALADNPPVLLLDEPTGALDTKATASVEDLLQRYRDDGGTILFTSHDTAQVARLASRRLVIRDGALREETA
ncbi:MAG: ABC transporter ATP-binding protein [Alphaproteobacteria bacterium]